MNPPVARLRLLTGDHDDLTSLRAWLTDEDALRGRVAVERQAPPAGHMGTITDVLLVAVGTGGAMTALARAVPLWLRSHAEVVVELREPGGRTVKVSAKGAVDAPALLQSALEQTDRDGEKGNGP